MVSKVGSGVDLGEAEEIDRSVNFVMSNEVAFERIMKN